MSNGNRIARILTCEDERLHDPKADMIRQLRELLEVDVIYVGTEAGPEFAVINQGVRAPGVFRNAKMIKDAKDPEVFALIGHYDCAGHPVSDEQHDYDVVEAAGMLSKELFGEPGQVAPIIAYPNPDTACGPTWLFKRMDLVSTSVPAVATVAAE